MTSHRIPRRSKVVQGMKEGVGVVRVSDITMIRKGSTRSENKSARSFKKVVDGLRFQ